MTALLKKNLALAFDPKNLLSLVLVYFIYALVLDGSLKTMPEITFYFAAATIFFSSFNYNYIKPTFCLYPITRKQFIFSTVVFEMICIAIGLFLAIPCIFLIRHLGYSFSYIFFVNPLAFFLIYLGTNNLTLWGNSFISRFLCVLPNILAVRTFLDPVIGGENNLFYSRQPVEFFVAMSVAFYVFSLFMMRKILIEKEF